MENPTSETPTEAPTPNGHEQRAALIASSLRGLSEALLSSGPLSSDADAIDHGFSLLYCGLISLSEIAQAQTDMVALAKRDIEAEIAARINDKAELLAEERVKERVARSFIGSKG